MNTEVGSSGQPRRRVLSLRAGIAISILVFVAATLGVEALLFPWARSLIGGPVLVGEWYGEVLTPTGLKQQLALEIIGQTDRCTPPCTRLEVRAQLCDTRGVHEYQGMGNPDNWRGTRFQVKVSAEQSKFEVARGIALFGVWEKNAIRATAEFGPKRGPSTFPARSSISESDLGKDTDALFRVPVTLRRGSDDEFDAACRRLRS